MRCLQRLRMPWILPLAVLAGLSVFDCTARAGNAYFGQMKANKVLFLGNSMCLIPSNGRGLEASSVDKDYVHLTASSIKARTGADLRLHPQTAEDKNEDENFWNAGDANVLNLADIFERGYATYSGSGRLQWQLDWKPDIVVLQIGENVPSAGFDSATFKSSLKALLSDLKQSNNPNIFITSHIMFERPLVDDVKKEVINEDTSGRVFYVDMSYVHEHSSTYLSGRAGHPNDAGMQKIADILFASMEAHSVPEPSSLALILSAGAAVVGLTWRQRR